MNVTGGPAVPLFDLKQQYKGLQKQFEEAINRVLASGQFIMGPEVKALEEEVAQYCGVANAIACASGTDAISLALQALDIGPGDEVIVPPFTFYATASCVSRLGAKPVFADIDPATYAIDPQQVEDKITSRTKAIIVVHLFGQCAEMEPLWRVAEKHHLHIIEDAAQAIGSEYQGKRTGTLGAIACLSFYPTKNLGAFGDAGMVVTNDTEWAKKMACCRVHGAERRYYHKYLGLNSRLDALQAAILRVKMPWLERWNDARKSIAKRYDELIDQNHLGHFLRKPVVQPDRKHTFHQYVVRVVDGQRDYLRAHLQADNIGTEVYYPLSLHMQEVFAHLGHQEGDFPASEQACREVLALPIYPELAYEQQKRVVQSCAAFVRGRARMAA
jgi:dTDP-4-amino-4,6-dideoxygalactose transaminase